MNSKGIVLAGGSGTRLHPMTLASSKQLLPVYDKPMIYYPLTVLMLAGIRDIMIISTPQDLPQFQRLLGDGRSLGVNFSYAEQPRPEGIAQAFLIADEWLAGQPCALVLGDNLIFGEHLSTSFREAAERPEGATVFAYQVRDPERYGVVVFDERGHATEIIELNRFYLEEGTLHVERLGRGCAWLDAGTPDSLHQAAGFVQTIQSRQGMLVGCPEEVAFRMGFIGVDELKGHSRRLGKTDLGRLLADVAAGLHG
jgi:glucose-1-phosphate thymidylyltransferase